MRTIRDNYKQAVNVTTLATNNSNCHSKECLTFTVANVVDIGDILSYALIRMRKNSLVPHCADRRAYILV